MKKLILYIFILFASVSTFAQKTIKTRELITDTLRVKDGAVPDSMAGYASFYSENDSARFLDQNDIAYNLLTWRDSVENYHQRHGIFNGDSVNIAYNGTTRTITVTPVGTSWLYYFDGTPYEITATIEEIHANTTGYYYLYYNSSNTIQFTSTAFSILTDIPIATVYYNADSVAGVAFNEKHNADRNLNAHYEFHFTVGAYWHVEDGGLAIADYTLAPSSPADSDNQYSVSAGEFHDEDIELQVDTLAAAGPYALIYRYGADGDWAWSTDTVPFWYNNYIQWNEFTGGAWQLTAAVNNRFVNYYVVHTGSIDTLFTTSVIPSQSIFSTLAEAQSETIADVSFGSFPTTEIISSYKITYKTNASYSTLGKCRIEYVTDTRLSTSKQIISAAPAGNHNALSGLQGTGYYHVPDSVFNFLTDANAQLENLHTDGTPTFGSITVTDSVTVAERAYNATTWNGSFRTPTSNAVRDQFEKVQDSLDVNSVRYYGVLDSLGRHTDNYYTLQDSVTQNIADIAAIQTGDDFIQNDTYFLGLNYAGDSTNLWKINKYNQIEFGIDRLLQSQNSRSDAGFIYRNIPLQSSEYGDSIGYKDRAGGFELSKSYSIADGSGGLNKVEHKLNGNVFAEDSLFVRDSAVLVKELDPIWAADSANVLHFADTVASIATKYDLDTMNFIYDTDLSGIRDTIGLIIDTLGFHTDSIQTNIDNIASLQDSIDNHTVKYYSLRDTVRNEMDSTVTHTVRYYGVIDSLARHTADYYTLQDSVSNNMDSIANHTVRYYDVLDSLSIHNGLIYANVDSITRHTTDYYSLRDSVRVNIDSIAVHTDSISNYNTRINAKQDALTVGTDTYFPVWNSGDFVDSRLLAFGNDIYQANTGSAASVGLYLQNSEGISHLYADDAGFFLNIGSDEFTFTASGITVPDSVTVADRAYNATTWNGSFRVPTSNAVRDQFEKVQDSLDVNSVRYYGVLDSLGRHSFEQAIGEDDNQ